MNLFLTGAAGFVGHTVLHHVLENTDWNVTCPVTMRHRGDQYRIEEMAALYPDRVDVVRCDLSMPFDRHLFKWGNKIDYIWNIASDSHVDRSLTEPERCIRNNVELILNVLQFARVVKPKLFLQMSTDEVYGPADAHEGHKEWSPIKPSNPYSASKAAQEAVCYAYWRAFGIPLVITNTMNLVGPGQHPEKFIPKTIRALKAGNPVTVHSSPEGVSGSRCWIDTEDFAAAWLFLTTRLADMDQGSITYYPTMKDQPLRFNIVGNHATNLEVAECLGKLLQTKPKIEKVNFHESRPGHDMHYGLNGEKMAAFGWEPKYSVNAMLKRAVEWYENHPAFLEKE